MQGTLSIRTNTAGAGTSSTLRLAGYGNSGGTGRGILRASWQNLHNDGSFSSVIVQDSSDESSWSTLWDLSTLTGVDEYINLYTFEESIRISWTWAASGSPSSTDPGARVSFRFRVYGMPEWDRVVVCRPDMLESFDADILNTDKNFQGAYPDAARLAKRDIGAVLMMRGVDPHRVFTDGHPTAPTVPALETAGALRTLYYLWFGGKALKDEAWNARLMKLDEAYRQSVEDALQSGALTVDLGQDGSEDPADRVATASRVLR